MEKLEVGSLDIHLLFGGFSKIMHVIYAPRMSYHQLFTFCLYFACSIIVVVVVDTLVTTGDRFPNRTLGKRN